MKAEVSVERCKIPPGQIVDTQVTIAGTSLAADRSYTATTGGGPGRLQGALRRATLGAPPSVPADRSVAIEGRTAEVVRGGVGPAPA